MALGFNQVVYERLHFDPNQLFSGHIRSDFSQDGISDVGDVK